MDNVESWDYRKLNIEFYRLLTGSNVAAIADIPPASMQFMAGMEYWDMLRPVLVHSLRGGAPVKALAEYWGVSRVSVRAIRNRYELPVYTNVTG